MPQTGGPADTMTNNEEAPGLEALFGGDDPLAAITSLLASTRKSLAERSAEGVAGGGAVRITLDGERRVVAVHIAPDVFEGGDAALLEDLLIAAANDAYDRVEGIKAETLDGFTGLFGGAPA